jgi:uncharacterized membrane protein
VTNSKTSVSKSREGRRWVIFAAACIAFVFCLIALWLLLTADALATPLLIFGWMAAPAMLGFTGWLAVKCIRTKGEDPFYEPNQLDPP